MPFNETVIEALTYSHNLKLFSIVYHINVVLNLSSFVYCFIDIGKHLFSLQSVSQVYN